MRHRLLSDSDLQVSAIGFGAWLTCAARARPWRERGVRLARRAGLGRFDAVTDGLVRVTQGAGGFVAASQIARTRDEGTATFVLRIPAVRLDAAVAQLSRLG